MILYRHHRVAPACRPLENRRVHRVVHVDHVGSERPDEGPEVDVGGGARRDRGPLLEGTRSRDAAVDHADRQAQVVSRLDEPTEETEHPRVGPTPIGEAIGHVQNPHDLSSG